MFLASTLANYFFRQIQYRTMASEEADVVPSSTGPPDQNTGPPGHDLNIESTLRQLNTNRGTMTQLLTEVCARLPTGNIDESSSSRSPPGAGQERRRRCSVSISSDEPLEHENESQRKSRREEDCLSVHATDDDVAQLLAESPTRATAPDSTNVAGKDELLTEVVASLQEEDTKGPKVQQQLADIAIKRWGTKLQSEKITSILGKQPQPENCEDMAIGRVNPEIWAPLNAAKRKADLRLANMQQALQKATFAIVTTCDKLLAVKSQIDTKDMVTDSIDAIALVGHVVSEISSIRLEQLRPSLKHEFQTICSNSVPPSSKPLFGEDLAKQICDAKETSRIGLTTGAIQNMTTPETAGVTTLIRVVDMTKATKVAQGSLFWERIPLNGMEETITRPHARDREAIMASLEQLKVAVSAFPPFVESSLRNYL